MSIIPVILAPVLLFLSAAVLYLFALAAAYFFCRPGKRYDERAPELRFAVIIPAHNEAEGISATLESMKNLDYPAHLYDAVVIADNCTDATAEAAGKEGMRCLVREDPSKKGKGHALEYALRVLLREEFDCFIVVDADSVLTGNFLRVMNSRMLAGHGVVQACYGMSNPDAGPLSYLFFIGNVLENRLFYGGKSKLGLPVNLRGNGMCFSRRVLEMQPWNAYSVVEDTEYGLKLIQRGVKVHFEQDAQVLARQPETLGQARNQRIRWASGNMAVTRAYALRLMLKGLFAYDLALFDTGFGLLVLSKPLLLLLSLLSAAVSLFYFSAGGKGGAVFAGWAVLLLLAQTAYLLTGIFMEEINCLRMRYLLLSPVLILWFFLVASLGLVGYRGDLWLRTKRV